ncbi:MAG: LytTR family transcriptional regulator [Clostridia bacterium]|nr:LytTR family transcriptional regulator [Clostridia bacterium]
MKFNLFIGTAHEDEVTVYAKNHSRLVTEIQRLCEEDAIELIGTREYEKMQIVLSDTYCFTVEESRVYAITKSGKWQLKCRLYNLEESLPQSFVKINQSCIANIKMIHRFDTSLSGALAVRFKNGYCDYVSRRNLKTVKERLGL